MKSRNHSKNILGEKLLVSIKRKEKIIFMICIVDPTKNTTELIPTIFYKVSI